MAIGTTALAIGGSLAGSAIQGMGAKSAAKAQQKAADQQIALQREIYDDTTQRYAPFYDSGTNALAAYNYELGLGPRPTFGGTAPQIETVVTPGSATALQGAAPFGRMFGTRAEDRNAYQAMVNRRNPQSAPSTTAYNVGGNSFATLEEAQAWANANKTGGAAYGGFQKTPGYDFRLNEGLDAIQAGAAARGGLYSGAAMKALQQHGQDYATSEYTPYLNRLAGMTDMGSAAAGNMANAGANMGAGVGSALASKGNAQAAGSIGFGNAINGGIQNMLGYMNYQQNLNTAPASSPRPVPNPWY